MDDAARSGTSKAFRRLTGFLILCYVFSYLDRINIGFANLTMAKDLHLSATMFGMANSIFYVAYALFEIPSNLALARYGAKVWIPRIMITWGVCSCLTALAWDQYSLYALRFLVGAAEAGLFPGVILYLSYWFGSRQRARANAIFVIGMPLALLIGSPLSGFILQMHGLGGLAGWKWLFLIEGLPSIVMGIAAWFYLADRPSKAKWLTDDEKAAMEATVAAENAVDAGGHTGAFRWKDLLNLPVMLLAFAYFCGIASNNTISTWTPLVVKEMLGNTDDTLLIGIIGAIAPVFAILAIPLWSRSSDLRNERRYHVAATLSLAAAGWLVIIFASAPAVKLAGLVCASVGGFCFIALFWTLATPLLAPASRPAGIGLISTAGLMASIVSPGVVGALRDLTHSYHAGFWYNTVLLIAGIGALLFATLRKPSQQGQTA